MCEKEGGAKKRKRSTTATTTAAAAAAAAEDEEFERVKESQDRRRRLAGEGVFGDEISVEESVARLKERHRMEQTYMSLSSIHSVVAPGDPVHSLTHSVHSFVLFAHSLALLFVIVFGGLMWCLSLFFMSVAVVHSFTHLFTCSFTCSLEY